MSTIYILTRSVYHSDDTNKSNYTFVEAFSDIQDAVNYCIDKCSMPPTLFTNTDMTDCVWYNERYIFQLQQYNLW